MPTTVARSAGIASPTYGMPRYSDLLPTTPRPGRSLPTPSPTYGGSTGGSTYGGLPPDPNNSPELKRQRQEYEAELAAKKRQRDEEALRQLQIEMQQQQLRDLQSSSERTRMMTQNGNNPVVVENAGTTVSNGGGVDMPGGSRGSGGTRGGGGGGGDDEYVDPSILENLIGRFSQPAPAPVAAPPLPGRTPGPVVPSAPVNNGPSLTFSRAKDVSGRQGRAAINSLRDVMSGRNMGDSGLEAELGGNILTDIARFNSDAEFRDLSARDERNWDAAKLAYTGALQERGQDVGYNSNIYSGGISQRGQDISRQTAMLSMLPQLASLARRRTY